MSGRILAVDHGDKRIGLAISDLTGTIANPCSVIQHVSRLVDAASVAAMAQQQQAIRIIVGQSFDMEGQPNPQGRKSARFAEVLRTQTELPVDLWDEYGSTDEAQFARRAMGGNRQSRKGHLDELAAVVILQSYLDAHKHE